MKTFDQFIRVNLIEDFNSPGATQFMIKAPASKKGQSTDTMMFYEHTGNLNISRYSKSFLSQEVVDSMKAFSNDWRVLVYSSANAFDIFVWSASVLHSSISKALDLNKNLNKYPNTIKYNFLYNESQLLMKGDSVGSSWCFPFIIWKNEIVVNLIPDALSVLQQNKDIKNLLGFSDVQWKNLMKDQKCSL